MRKVSESCRVLRERGLLQADAAARVALVAELMPTLAGSAARGTEVVPSASVSTAALGEALNLSPRAIRGHVEHLRTLGLMLECAADGGYRLARAFTHLVVPEAVLPLLLEQVDPSLPWIVGLPYHYRRCCGSTNETLKDQATTSPAGTVLVTEEQTEGRGRIGRSWISLPGKDLAFSVLLRPSARPELSPLFSLAAGVAIAEVLEALPGFSGRVLVKWPNDVLVDDKKVCGILLESRVEGERVCWAVAGIGLNVNSDPEAMLHDLPPSRRGEWRGKPRPTSLAAELRHEVARGGLLADLLAGLTRRWTELDPAGLLDELRARDGLLGRRVQVFAGPSDDTPIAAGEAAGIGPAGELLVKDRSGRTASVFAGDVTVRTSE